MEQQIENEQIIKTLLSELGSKDVNIQLYAINELCKLFNHLILRRGQEIYGL